MLKPYLGKCVDVVIDRLLESKHPKWDIYYIVNYGYIEIRYKNDKITFMKKVPKEKQNQG